MGASLDQVVAVPSPRRINALRDRIGQWASLHHQPELDAGIQCYLAKHKPDEQMLLSAIGFSLLSPADDGPSLIERWAAAHPRLPRAERKLLQSWASTRFSLLRVVEVEPEGPGGAPGAVAVHDELWNRPLRIVERAAADHFEAGMWVAAFFFEDDRRWVFEGTISDVPPAVQRDAMLAAVDAFRAIDVSPDTATPADTRRVSRATMTTVRGA